MKWMIFQILLKACCNGMKNKNIFSLILERVQYIVETFVCTKSIAEATCNRFFLEILKEKYLKDKPEKIAQALLASCLKMALNGKGIVVRELSSGG
ncbi:MAG: hypothetical protein U0X87_11185 [Anaerolineales bacterium]